VILVFAESTDLKNLASEEKTPPWLREALDERANFGADPVPQRTLETVSQLIREQPALRPASVDVLTRTSFVRNFLALQNVSNALGIAYPRITPVLPSFRQTLSRANDLTRQWGGRFVLLYIPRIDRYMGLLPQSFAYDSGRAGVLAVADDLKIDVIDLTKVFQKDANPRSFYAGDAHLSERGAAVAAHAVDEYLSANSDAASKILSGL
jgi:hypothetical protein